jgi:hypothetical protein
MPINELERHPFLNYLETEIERTRSYKGLIIGSFPIYSCTDTIHNIPERVVQRFIEDKVTMRFFYCSRRSKFWEYCSSAHGEENPIRLINDFNENRVRTIDFLNRNNLLITDVIYQTNRKQFGDEDSNLWKTKGADQWIIDNLLLNYNIPNILAQHPSIINLYFTAQGVTGNTPFGWFNRIFGNNIAINPSISGLSLNINGRNYRAFLLPTPKPRGIHFSDNQRSALFVNYLQSIDAEFHNEISNIPEDNRTTEQKERLKNLRHDFIVERYRQAFIENNLLFNGAVGR